MRSTRPFYVTIIKFYGFTGAFVGMAAYDLYDHTSFADFTHFSYRVLQGK